MKLFFTHILKLYNSKVKATITCFGVYNGGISHTPVLKTLFGFSCDTELSCKRMNTSRIQYNKNHCKFCPV